MARNKKKVKNLKKSVEISTKNKTKVANNSNTGLKTKSDPKQQKTTNKRQLKTVEKTSEPIAKRRRNGSIRKSEATFTQKEKKAFYECLVQKGFSCLHNENILMHLFPNRTLNEIKALIESYTRKAQELNRKYDKSIDSESVNSNKAPIDKWFDIIHQLLPNSSKKDDISAVFVDIFEELNVKKEVKSEESSRQMAPNYNKIKECISEALNGRYAPQMKPIDAFVVVKLIEELKDLIKRDGFDSESEYLSYGQWWQHNDKSEEDYFRSIYLQRQRQSSAQNESNSSRMNGSALENGETLIIPNNDDSGDSSYNLHLFPKLRKIIDCLNPIKIPTDLTENEYNRWQN